jgi:pyruvate formate lyase activating enzyme
MQIGGFQKTSLLDYPDTISAIIWTVGCNFNCPFCYNPQLVKKKTKNLSEEEVLSFLKKRQGLIEGLSISGGEPLLQNDIVDFTKKVKKLGYLVKIDTNGTFPERLEELIEKKLVDYVAMDVKAPKKKYGQLTGVKTDIKKIERSIDIIKHNAPDYEFKTTFVPGLLKKEDILKIAQWLEGSKTYFLQQFKTDVPLISSKLEKITPYPKEYIVETFEEIQSYFKKCEMRGV